MANEDARENSVLGGAIKIAATGAILVGGAKGVKGLMRNYDDLGRTFGKAGDKVSDGIENILKKTDSADGSAGKIRQWAEKNRDNMLEKKYKQVYDEGTKLINKNASGDVLTEMNTKARASNYESAHESYKKKSVGDKRDMIDAEREFNKTIKKANQQSKKADNAKTNTTHNPSDLDNLTAESGLANSDSKESFIATVNSSSGSPEMPKTVNVNDMLDNIVADNMQELTRSSKYPTPKSKGNDRFQNNRTLRPNNIKPKNDNYNIPKVTKSNDKQAKAQLTRIINKNDSNVVEDIEAVKKFRTELDYNTSTVNL